MTDYRKKFFPCDECYAQASEQAKGSDDPEEIGSLAYNFMHYEYNHGNKERLFPELFTTTNPRS